MKDKTSEPSSKFRKPQASSPTSTYAPSVVNTTSRIMQLQKTLGNHKVTQLMKFVSNRSDNPIQMTRMSKGIEYATDEQDAINWLKANVIDFEDFSNEDQEIAKTIAQNKVRGVLAAKKTLEATAVEMNSQGMRDQRENDITGDYLTFKDGFGNGLANSVFDVAKAGYVSNNKNVSVAGEYTQDEVDEAIASWRDYLNHNNLSANITNVLLYRRQDKAAVGKGNVGDTLDKRSVQANFISTWIGRKVNVHVDISD